jgi:hypothetical protein
VKTSSSASSRFFLSSCRSVSASGDGYDDVAFVDVVCCFLLNSLQDRLQRMRFSDMLTTSEGFELTRALIDALMSAYKDSKGDQVSTRSV